MKNKIFRLTTVFAALVLAFSSCNKQKAITPIVPAEGTGQTSFKYTVSVINNKDVGDPTQSNAISGDTLIIKINGVQKIKQVGASVGGSLTLSCVTGDRLYIYYNPGKITAPSGVVTAENRLTVYFNEGTSGSGYHNYTVDFDGCRCIGEYDQAVK